VKKTVMRPLIRYHGAKWMIAPWIISYIPTHRIYVEPYGGGASILLRKSRSHEEVYNDLDSDIVNLFRVVRDNGKELTRLLKCTPFSREEYEQAYMPTDDPIEKARRTVVRGYMGRSANGTTGKISEDGKVSTGFRAKSDRSGRTAARVWENYTVALQNIIERLQGVVIENRDALEVIQRHDSKNTFFYIDPPYLSSVRDAGSDYRYELTENQHIELANLLNEVKGAVMVSGYHSELYDELYKGWVRREKSTYADGALPRTEVLWMRGMILEPGLFEGEM
jgi:DNA adenine methylase